MLYAMEKKENGLRLRRGEPAGKALFQAGFARSVLDGDYDGCLTLGELKKHGDLGIGTFDAINGELILLDGVVYQALGDGSVITPPDTLTTPFANAAFFAPDGAERAFAGGDLTQLSAALTAAMTAGSGCFYLARIRCRCRQMTVRSEWGQKKPYRPWEQAMGADERTFVYTDTEGDMAALYCPADMAELNVPGWHFHFLTRQRDRGGHVCAAQLTQAVWQIQAIPAMALFAPAEKEEQLWQAAQRLR